MKISHKKVKKAKTMSNTIQLVLQLEDFVCPQSYENIPAIAQQANVYQIIEITDDKIVAKNLFNPVEIIVESKDFFTSLK